MSVAIPLISAGLAALVAWIVALRQTRTARETWVLDKRYLAYEKVIDTANTVLVVPGAVRAARFGDAGLVADLLASLHRLELVAPEAIREKSDELGKFVVGTMGSTTVQQRDRIVAEVNALIDLLREDLVPRHLR